MAQPNAVLIKDDNLRAKFNALDRKLRKKLLRPAISKALRPVVRTAKALAPGRTGALKSTIRSKVYTVKSGELNGMVSAGGKVFQTPKGRYRFARSKRQKATAAAQGNQVVDYATVVEYGRRNRGTIPARPYLRPAMERNRNNAINEIAKAVEKAVNETFRG